MIPRLARVALLWIFSIAQASAQVRPIAKSALAPRALPAQTRQSFSVFDAAPGPLLAAPSLSPAPGLSPRGQAPAPALAAPSLLSASPLTPVAPVRSHAGPRVLDSLLTPSAPTPRAMNASLPGDELFDGRAPRRTLSAASAPESGPEKPRPLLGPKAVRHARLVSKIVIPIAAVAAVAGAAAPHHALAAVHYLGQAAYWLANPFAFAFTVPQIHRMLSRRSASVSALMMTVGLLSTMLTTLNFAYDGKNVMMYRNLAQALGFAIMLGLKVYFTRSPGKPLPTARGALLEAGLAAAGIAALLSVLGPPLTALVCGVPMMAALLVPIQIATGFGFTYLMYAQLSKMRRDQSAGDSSPGMMWAYLGTKTIWVWSLAMMLSLVTATPWMTLSAGILFTGLCWFVGKVTLSRMLKAPWSFLPESISLPGHTLTRSAMAEVGAFLVLSCVILALSAAGYYGFVGVLGVPDQATSRFAMYLLYTVQSLVACLATAKTLRMRARFDKK